MKSLQSNWFYCGLIIVLSIPALFSLLLPDFFSTHDGYAHVVRFVHFYQAFLDGQILPRWINQVAYGLGSPVLMFNGSLPFYASMIPKVLGFNFSQSLEIIFAASFIISGITCFFWLKSLFGKTAALVGAIAYLYAPYRFVDIYVRGAFPESFTFIFPPLLLLSGQELVSRFSWRWFFVAVLSLSGLILTHNVIALLFAAIFLIYGFYLSFIQKKLSHVKYILCAFIVSILLTSFYWLPAFIEKSATHLDYLNSTNSYIANFVSLKQLLYSPWGWGPLDSDSPMSLQLGIGQYVILLLTFIGCFIFKPKDKELLYKIGFFICLLIVSLFLMLPNSKIFWDSISLLSFFLYPWRFLILSITCVAFFAALSVSLFKNNLLLVILIIGLLIYANRNHSQLVGRIDGSDRYFQSQNDTTDMWGEFMPKTVDLELINACKKVGCQFDLVWAPSSTNLQVVSQDSRGIALQYDSQGDSLITVNQLSFPGWEAVLDQSATLPITHIKSGPMQLTLPKGNHTLTVRFEDTKIRKIGLAISGMTLLGILFILWKKRSSF